MYATLWLTALATSSSVPDVSAGPDLADEARATEAPIAKVTVFSDRATVVRRGSVRMDAANVTARLPDLPGNTLAQTVRVTAKGADVWRVEVAPVDRERVSIAQADDWLVKIDTLGDEIARIDARVAVEDFKLGLLSNITPAAPVPEAQRDGRPAAPLAPSVWGRALKFLGERRTAARDAKRKLGYERAEKQEALAAIQREVQRLNQGGFSNRRQQVIVILGKKSANNASIEVEYTVPGASWRPAYDLVYLAKQNQVLLETSAQVTQATGEPWDDVELELSTAIPGMDIRVPKLLTWTLGEAKELIPRPRPRTAPPRPKVFAPPTPTPSERDRLRAERLAELSSRLSNLGVAVGNIVGASGSGIGTGTGMGGLGYGRGAKKQAELKSRARARRRSRSRPPPAPRPPSPAPSAAPAEAYAGETMVMAEMDDDYADSSRDRSVRFTQGSVSGRRSRLSLFESPPPPRPRLNDPSLPAMLAGGFDYVYGAQTKTTVPSDGRVVRVPLASDRHPVEAYYEATPSLAKTAYLEASVVNESDRPILGGPVAIFVGDQFSGDGKLDTTGAGGKIELPLGADEDVKVERRIIPATETTGFISKDDVTTYRVVMEVANYKRRRITVSLMEPLPKTTNDDIEVKLVKASPKQSKGPDEDGLMRWDVVLNAGQKKTVELVYSIERPENWRLYQR